MTERTAKGHGTRTTTRRRRRLVYAAVNSVELEGTTDVIELEGTTDVVMRESA